MYTETGALLQHAAGVEKSKQESGEKTLREGGTGHSDGDGDVTERYSATAILAILAILARQRSRTAKQRVCERATTRASAR